MPAALLALSDRSRKSFRRRDLYSNNDKNAIHLTGILSEGYGIIPKKIMKASDLGPYEKLLVAYMLSYTGAGNNECFPSYRTMEVDLQISRPTIAKALKKLEELGYIHKSKLFPGDPLRHNSKYCLRFLDMAIVNVANNRRQHREHSRATSLTRNNKINNISENHKLPSPYPKMERIK